MVEEYHHDHPETTQERKQNRRSLTIAFLITTGFMIAEVIGGIISNSLALLSDALHMLSDSASLALSLFAMWVAQKPPTKHKTFGYYRFEILAAFINGVTLIIISLYIYVEAYHRFMQPPEVGSITMITIAVIGLLANLVSAWVLTRGQTEENLNIRSAFLHVLGDILGSAGAIVAGILILTLDWQVADPIISAVIATLVLISGIRVTRESLHVLMEGTPKDIALESLVRRLKEIPGVVEVHELHIWTITSGFHSLSCHIEILPDKDDQKILKQAKHIVQEEFGIYHTTIQIERTQKPGT
ncbi:MAG: cation transporter [Bacillaceae bacterium]|nr:cation transporter [Bacillaceae bacterium]